MHPLFAPFNDIELEIIRSEYSRTRIMIFTLLALLGVALANYLWLGESLVTHFGSFRVYYIICGWMLALLCFELVALRRIRWFHRRGMLLPGPFRLIFCIVEISMPGVLMAYMVVVHKNLLFIDSPVMPLYFLIILLSTLHLNLWLSVLTALVAAIEYTLVIRYTFRQPEAAATFALPSAAYYVRCFMLLLSGGAAGFVAEQIKKRIKSYLKMQQSKTDIELTFGQQVSTEIVAALAEQGDAARSVEASILAMDIRDFSGFAREHSPDEILAFQNKVFAPVLDIIRQYGGIVNQILGDGIMAIFGAPVTSPEHAAQALQAARAVRGKIKELSDTGSIPTTRIGIGIHCGEVITGNIGNEQRRQYSISGTPVIVAFRVEQLNKELGSDLLITETLKDQAGCPDIAMTAVGERSLKGLGASFRLYRVD